MWANYDDIVALITAAGIDPDLPLQVGTAKMVRCRMAGERRKKRGAYRLYEMPLNDGQTILLGTYGFNIGAEYFFERIPFSSDFKKSVDPQKLKAVRERQRLEQQRIEAEDKALAARAAAKASRWWQKLSDSGQSPYLERKGFAPGALYGARVSPSGNLVVPILDGEGRIHGLEVIYGDPAVKKSKGTDKNMTPYGCKVKGHWFQIGSPASGLTLLCEGFATGASLHEATGLPVAVAFNAGNLMPVAVELRKRYKGVRILVCADDDYLTDPNTGVRAAEATAIAVDGHVATPTFPVERSTDKARKGPTDYNDLHVLPEGGLQAVRAQIEAALTSAGWDVPPRPPRAGLRSGGGGGDDAGARRNAVSILSLDEVIDRFIHIDDATGDFVFDTWTKEVCKRSKAVTMLPAGVRWDDVKRSDRWQQRAVYIDQIGFDPGGEDPNIVCNRWSGWPTVPVQGSCQIMLDTLRYLCGHDPESDAVFRWVLCWLAYPIQHPGAKLQSAIVLHGPQGTGKSQFFEAVAKIYGDYAAVLNQGAIEDKFNSDWSERKLFIVADEIVARADMHHLKNQLKTLVTGEWVRVNPKNVAAHRERNHMNIVFLSNEKIPIVIENDDRRHLIIWTPPPLSQQFYDDLAAEIANGGVAAFHHFLLNLDLGDFKPWSRPPMTSAKRDLAAMNRESVDRFLIEWQDGEIEGLPFCPCGSADLYTAYQNWCRKAGVKFPRESHHFIGHIAKMPGWYHGLKNRYENMGYAGPVKRHRFIVPAAKALEAAHLAGSDNWQRPEGCTETQWLTDAFWAFRNGVTGGNSRPKWDSVEDYA